MNYLLPLIFFLVSLSAAAQDPNYVVIDKSKGLPSNSVYHIFQDSRGFIWVATEEGLSRYDGYQFKTFYNPKQTSKAGSEISEDKYGRIWYENFDGYLYYVENDSLKQLQQNKPQGYFVYGISQQSLFTISQLNQVDIYDLKTLRIRQSCQINTKAIGFSRYGAGRFYLLTEGNIISVGEKGDIVSLSVDTNFVSLILAGKDQLWINQQKQAGMVYQMKNGSIKPAFFNAKSNFIHTNSFDGEHIWFCSSSGTFAFDTSGKAMENGQLFFPNKSISCVLKDHENNYWFSSTNEGLFFVPDFSSRRYFTGFNPTRLCTTGDQLYFGTRSGGLWKTNLNTMQPEQLLSTTNNHSIDFLEKGDAFYPLLATSDTLRVLQNDITVKKWTSSLKDFEVVAPGTYACALTGYAGLFFAPGSPDNKWKHLNWGKPDSTDNPANRFGYMLIQFVRAKSVAYDSLTETIYYATNTGLFAVTVSGAREIRNEGKTLFVSKIVFANGELYGLSSLGEVFRIRQNGVYEKLNEKFGLPEQQVKGIKKCGRFLLFYTSSEFSYFDFQKGTDQITHIPAYTTDIYDLEVWRNTIYISSADGILCQQLKPEDAEKFNPVFVLNAFLVNGKQFAESGNYVLDHKQNTIEINYSILSFKTGSEYPLYYRINENEWKLCSFEMRSLLLASLAPGSYRIEFRFGDESEKRPVVSILNFTIDKPWWYKWWAIVLYAGLFVSGIFILYQKQIGIQQRKNKMLTEKIELEKNLNNSILTSIKSQMNPHFFYNALNTIQSFIYANDKQNAGNYLSKFSKLTRMVLEMSEKELISLQEEITACTLYLELEEARFGKDFHFSIEVKSGVSPEQTRLPSMIIQPYIENAVKHGLLHKKGEQKLQIIFERKENNLIVTIDDNGIGRQRSAELNAMRKDKHQPFSSEANQKRLELLNRGRKNPLGVKYIDKQDENGLPCGTTVIINIPV